MAKISKVFYAEIAPEVCTMEQAGEYYFHFNLLQEDELFQKTYEDYELKQLELRNSVISQAMKNGELPGHPIMSSAIFGVSTMKQKPVIITEF
ncbi:MAG: hypothetical protein NC489_25590 [Ruminococcus flavefaciens]|nr:hypothetical protein [Ruminococcus flavefaciens]